MTEQLPPGSLLILGGLLAPLLRGRARQAYWLALPLLSFAHLWSLPAGFELSLRAFEYDLEIVRVDRLSQVFGIVFHIAAFLCALYSLYVRDPVQQIAAALYAGSAIGAVYAGDLITLFVYWEATAASSAFLVWARRRERSYRAGLRYLLIQVGSGVLLLAGTVLYYADGGSLSLGPLDWERPGTLLIFLAFGIKAAFPFLHNWVQDAYPEATVTGVIFLVSFTTKLAVYALARSFAGTEILIPIGAAMTAFPIFYAVIENDLRRVLAYSLNNQLGFMVVGVGIGTPLALNGTAAYAFVQILFEGLLFMTMSAVLYRAGTIKGSELGGLYRSMPFTAACCIVGAASISAFPLFSGFVAKILILGATAEQHRTLTFLVLLFSSAGVFHHAGIKIPYFAFFAHDSGRRVKEAPLHMLLAMGIGAALCIGIGVYPEPLLRLLPHPVETQVYTATYVVGQLQLLFFAALAFGVLMRTGIYPPELPSVNLDSDWVYRRALPRAVRLAGAALAAARAALAQVTLRSVERLLAVLGRHYAPPGVFGEPWTTGTSALWVAVVLGAYLLLFYL